MCIRLYSWLAVSPVAGSRLEGLSAASDRMTPCVAGPCVVDHIFRYVTLLYYQFQWWILWPLHRALEIDCWLLIVSTSSVSYFPRKLRAWTGKENGVKRGASVWVEWGVLVFVEVPDTFIFTASHTSRILSSHRRRDAVLQSFYISRNRVINQILVGINQWLRWHHVSANISQLLI
jgi:hypothetical protein